jgi:hypothetical protein
MTVFGTGVGLVTAPHLKEVMFRSKTAVLASSRIVSSRLQKN